MEKQKKRPIKVTDLAFKVVRVRLSLRESQATFAKRFQVNRKTVYFWETGQTLTLLPIYQMILDKLFDKLKENYLLVPEAQVEVLFKEKIELRGDAENIGVNAPQKVS